MQECSAFQPEIRRQPLITSTNAWAPKRKISTSTTSLFYTQRDQTAGYASPV
jgi:hypothetical protein